MTKQSAGPAALVLKATVARRFYVDGATKSDIAAELGLSRFKVARLLDDARASGLVRIELDYRGELDLELSARLRTTFDLTHCLVIDAPEDDEVTLRTSVGRAAAQLLAEIVEVDDVLGLGWARSLLAMRSALTRLAPCPVVQLTGALSRPDVDESSIELVRDVVRVSEGPAYYFYAPMMVPDAATARVLRTQPDIARAMRMFPQVTKAVVGLGAWQRGQSTVADALPVREWSEMYDMGVRVDLAGIQLDARGEPVTTSLTDRLIGVDAAQMHAVPDVVAIVYGQVKAPAVTAAVRGGFVKSVVTHRAVARSMLGEA